MNKKICFFLCLAFLFLALPIKSGQAGPGDEAFNAANKEFKTLLADEQRAGRRDNWENLAAKFLKIQKSNSKAEVAPRALFMYARCAEELGLRSRRKGDFQAACKYFAEVAAKYPKHSWADDALLRKAVIERDYLKDPGAARKTLEGLLSKFKNGDMRGKAQAMLKEIKSGQGAPPPAGQKEPGETAPRSAERDAGQDSGRDDDNSGGRSAASAEYGEGVLRSITVRAASAKAKLEIELTSGGNYLYGYLPGNKAAGRPAYLVLEFEDSRKADDVKTTVAVPKGPVSQVRTTNQNGVGGRQDFTRVELALSQECTYTFSSTKNPPALLVELAVSGKSGQSRSGGGTYGGGEAGGGSSGAAGSGGKSQQAALNEQLGLGMKTIMVDAGHGGKDPGAASNGIKESLLVLKLAKMVGTKLKNKGFNVLYTRDSDKFISLENRSERANNRKVDMFLSLHVNANTDKSIWGVEAYYLDVARSKGAVRVAARENAVTEKEIGELQVILTDLLLNSKTGESKELAGLMVRSMDRSIKNGGYPVRDNGVRSAPFYVLMGARMPSVLVEIGYCTNPAEAKRLLSDKYLDSLSDGIVNGIVSYRNKLNGN